MPIKYSCFISYPHGHGELMEKFIGQLKKALDDYLGPYLDEEVYIDKERLNTGYKYNEELANAICQSIVMVVVYSPIYERHAYCLREYMAMEHLEEKRRQKLGDKFNPKRSMIYPIILRGRDDIPPKIKNCIQFCDFSKFSLATIEISKNQDYISQIEKIAADIYEHYKVIKDIETDCKSFKLPPEDETRKSWEREKKSHQEFPGRGR